MTRRRRLVLILIVALLLLGIGSWLVFERERIQPGMTRAEVEAVLGAPDGRMLEIDGTPVENVMLVWKDRKVVIEFDAADRVREVKSAPSIFDNLRTKLGF